VTVNPSTVNFLAAGPGVAGQSVTVSETGYTGAFTLSTTTCAGIATASPLSGSGTFTFSPVAAGTCSYVVTGKAGATATITITVTTTGVKSS